MSLQRRTIVEQVEIRRDGVIGVRMQKQIIDSDDPDNPIKSEFHRVNVPPGYDLEHAVEAVNQHLAAMGAGSCSEDEWDRVRRVIGLEQTPEVVEAFKAKQPVTEEQDA